MMSLIDKHVIEVVGLVPFLHMTAKCVYRCEHILGIVLFTAASEQAEFGLITAEHPLV